MQCTTTLANTTESPDNRVDDGHRTWCGAVIYAATAPVNLANVTISGNNGNAGLGGGLAPAAGPGPMNMKNTIIAGNTADRRGVRDRYHPRRDAPLELAGSTASSRSDTDGARGCRPPPPAGPTINVSAGGSPALDRQRRAVLLTQALTSQSRPGRSTQVPARRRASSLTTDQREHRRARERQQRHGDVGADTDRAAVEARLNIGSRVPPGCPVIACRAPPSLLNDPAGGRSTRRRASNAGEKSAAAQSRTGQRCTRR